MYMIMDAQTFKPTDPASDHPKQTQLTEVEKKQRMDDHYEFISKQALLQLRAAVTAITVDMQRRFEAKLDAGSSSRKRRRTSRKRRRTSLKRHRTRYGMNDASHSMSENDSMSSKTSDGSYEEEDDLY